MSIEEFNNIATFKNDDIGYIEFIYRNKGYVYNDFGGNDAKYKKLHKYDCSLLHNWGTNEVKTSIEKICSTNFSDLIKWLERYRGLLNTGYTFCPCIENQNYKKAEMEIMKLNRSNNFFSSVFKTIVPKKQTNLSNEPVEQAFYKWLITIKCLSKRTARSYVSAINTITEFAKSAHLININFFHIISSIELEKINNSLFENKIFQIKNNQGHQMYSAALNNYKRFIEDTENSLEAITELKVITPSEELPTQHTEINEKISGKEDANYILIKEVDWSFLNYGLVIAQKYHNNVWSAIGRKLKRGENEIIKLQINSKLFDATLTNVTSKERKTDVIQIRYSPSSDIALEIRKIFKDTYQYLITQRQTNGSSKIIDLPPKLKHSIIITYLKNDTFAISKTSYLDNAINPIQKDYSENRVDFSKQSEAYLFTTPYKMILFGKEIIVKNWADVLTKICEILIIKYPDDFFEFIKNPLFQKSRNCLFTYNEDLLTRDPKQLAMRQLSNGMWVEFRYAPYSILKICKSLFNTCSIDISSVVIFYKKMEDTQVNEIPRREEALDNIEIDIEESLSKEYKVDFTKQEDICSSTCPYKLTMNGSIFEIHSWVDVLLKLCEVLIIIQPKKVSSFDIHFTVKGSNRIYFTYTSSLLVAGRQLSNGIWIETNFNATEIVKICKLLCDECEFDIRNVEILFRRNSELHKSQEKVLVHASIADSDDLGKDEFFKIKYPLLYKAIEKFVKSSQTPLSFDFITAANQNVRKSTIRHILKNSNWSVYSGGKYIYRDNIPDFNGVAEILLTTLKTLFVQCGGYVSAKQLYNAVKSKLNDFFFYNGFESQEEVYDLAEHLFEKEHYKDNSFIFYNGIHIWEKEPDYPKSYTGLFVKWAKENNGIISREECMKWLENIGAGSIAANYSNAYNAGRHLFWQYDSYKFILVEVVIVDENWKDTLIAKLTYLLQDVPFVALRDIDDYWYNSLPSLPAEISWSPLLLQEVLGDIDIGFKTISAGDGQDINAVHAVVLPKNSSYNTFGDIVWKIFDEEYGTPTDKINTEDLRKILVKKNILQGNERLYVLHKAISNDLRFMWTDNYKNVFISKR